MNATENKGWPALEARCVELGFRPMSLEALTHFMDHPDLLNRTERIEFSRFMAAGREMFAPAA